jgi:hypothetical protein
MELIGENGLLEALCQRAATVSHSTRAWRLREPRTFSIRWTAAYRSRGRENCRFLQRFVDAGELTAVFDRRRATLCRPHRCSASTFTRRSRAKLGTATEPAGLRRCAGRRRLRASGIGSEQRVVFPKVNTQHLG